MKGQAHEYGNFKNLRNKCKAIKTLYHIRYNIDIEANSIYAITSLLALMETCGDDKIEVDPVALGKINQILNKNILNIWQLLDDFIYIVQAKSELVVLELFMSELKEPE